MIDMLGKRFGKLVVTSRAEKSTGSGQARWECVCDCGGRTVANGSNLRRGQTRSCGCAKTDANRSRLVTHGMSRTGGGKGHPLYNIWIGIRKRCCSPGDSAYPRYGGRGITMSPRWYESFTAFVADVGERPSLRHSIDRIDNDGNYEPGNVRWATAKEQASNRGPVARLQRENAALIAEVERLRTLLKPECGGPECKVVPMHYVDSCPTHQEDGGGFWYEGDGGTWADA